MALMDAITHPVEAGTTLPATGDAGDGETPQTPRTTIASRYEIDFDAPLDMGAVTIVYAGRDLRTRRDVAIKTLRPEFRDEPERRARFRREARLLAFLAHPHVIRVFDFVEDQGASWVVVEQIRGQYLSDLIAEEGPFAPDDASRIINQVASALAHLHARGLVHLDIHPDTLMLTDDDRVKLVDFGLAQQTGKAAVMVDPHQTRRAAYRAPEHTSGGQIGVATDIYALGCLAFELLRGHPPATGGDPAEPSDDSMGARQRPTAPSRSDRGSALPAPLGDVVQRAMAPRPAARFASAEAFARAMLAAVGGERLVDIATTSQTAPAADHQPYALPLEPRAILPKHERSAGDRGWFRLGIDRLSGILWRAVALVGVANLLLAAILFVSSGAVPGLYEPSPALAPGAAARVTVADWRVRQAPGLDATALWALAVGDELSVTGEAVTADGHRWWPVSLERGGGETRGFVAEEGIGAERRAPLDRLRAALGLE